MYKPTSFNEGFLPEEAGHQVYFAEFGNPDGPVILSIHGGPGGASQPKHASRFPLDTHRVVLFDQRGCGRSTAEDMLRENTTQALISDIERLRAALGIETWFVSGSSWGATLALYYAETHPDFVRGLLLSSVFTADAESLDWFGSATGVASLYRDVWEHRRTQLQRFGINHEDPRSVYDKLLELEGEEQKALAADILNWEGNLMSANSDVQYHEASELSDGELQYAKIFMHYHSAEFFLKETPLVDQVDTISHIPMVIVHGRHDVLCPYTRVWALKTKHGKAEVVALPQSNHALTADGAVARKYIFESFLQQHGS